MLNATERPESSRRRRLPLASILSTVPNSRFAMCCSRFGAVNWTRLLFRVDSLDSREFSRFDAVRFAALRIANNISGMVLLGPLTVCAGNLVARHEYLHFFLTAVYLSSGLHFPVDDLVDLHARLIVGRHD